jgi:hypothetical protein
MMRCYSFLEVPILCERLNRKVPCFASDDVVFFKSETIFQANPQ